MSELHPEYERGFRDGANAMQSKIAAVLTIWGSDLAPKVLGLKLPRIEPPEQVVFTKENS
jgi:hypothetical protein